MREQVTIALTHDEFAVAGHGGNDLARFEREDLVGVAVEQEQRSTA